MDLELQLRDRTHVGARTDLGSLGRIFIETIKKKFPASFPPVSRCFQPPRPAGWPGMMIYYL